MLLQMPILASASDVVEIDGIQYCLINKASEAEIQSVKSTYAIRGDIAIPETISYKNKKYKVTSIAEKAFGNCQLITSMIIPNTVKCIGESAFSYCTKLTTVKLPYELNVIEARTFSWCGELKSITIPNTVKEIREGAFYYCNGLNTVNISNGIKSIGEQAFFGCSSLTSINIPNSVESIGKQAFQDCKGLTTITIPQNIAIYNKWLFYGCSSLTKIIISNGVTTICEAVFRDCNIYTITIPNSVSRIDEYAFASCQNLNTVIIGKNVKKIDYGAFANCKELLDVYSLSEVPPTIKDYSVFSGSEIKYSTLHVPDASLDKYKNAFYWSQFGKIVGINDDNEFNETKKCKTPSIFYDHGKLLFSSETDGAVCYYNIADQDLTATSGNEVKMSATYIINAYATKAGYKDSDMANATLCWVDVEPQKSGVSDGIHSEKHKAIIIRNNENVLNIYGVPEGYLINVYDMSGRLVGGAKSQGESTYITTTLKYGDIGIVKFGNICVKVILK